MAKEKEYFGHPRFHEILEEVRELHNNKNHDYAGKKDPLANLKGSKRIGIRPFIGVMIRLQDKWSRLENFVLSGKLKVKDEGVRDTLKDNIVYSILALILLDEEEREQI